MKLMTRPWTLAVLLALLMGGSAQHHAAAQNPEREIEGEQVLHSFRPLFYPDSHSLEAILDVDAVSPKVTEAKELVKLGDLQGASQALLGDEDPELRGEPQFWFTLGHIQNSLNDRQKARQSLHEILQLPIDSRTTLVVWYLLGQLGETPPVELGKEVLGVVVEIALDVTVVVAGYADGTAYLISSTGSAVIGKPEAPEEPPDTASRQAQVAAKRMVQVAQLLVDEMPKETDRSLPQAGWIRVAVLTPSGVYAELSEESRIGETKLGYVAGAAQGVEAALVPLVVEGH